MENNFAAVDAELDALERDFTSGEMNAFGSRETQQAFISSFKRIADLESEVFYKTCAILKLNKSGEQGAYRSAVAIAKDQGAHLGDSVRSTDTSTNLGATDNGLNMTSNNFNGSFNATLRAGRFGPWSGEKAPALDLEEDSSEDGMQEQDRAFENVARHFQALESEFVNVSENLHQISREIIVIDALAEKLNNTAYQIGEGSMDLE